MKFVFFLFTVMTIGNVQAGTNRAINGILPENIEGQRFRVFKEMAIPGVREKVQDGEVVTLDQVEAHPKWDFFQFYVQNDNGNRIFNRKYTFSDLGIIHNRFMHVSLDVNDSVVQQGRGSVLHGILAPLEKRFDGKYEPVIVFLSRLDNSGHMIAGQVSTNYVEESEFKNIDYGIRFACASSKNVLMGVKWFPPLYLPKDDNASIHFPYNVKIKLNGGFHLMETREKFLSQRHKEFDIYTFVVTQEIEKHLLSSGAGAIKIPLSGWNIARHSWTSNGLSEAYLRVKNFCK